MIVPCLRAAIIASLHTSGVGLAQRAEDAAGMQPARALLAEDLVPVDLARLQLAHRRVTAVAATQRRAYAKPALRKVQPVAHRAPDAVVLHPLHVRLVHAALQHQVFDQPAHGIIGQRGHHRRLQSEAPPQPARHVVLAAALPHLELARRGHPHIAGIEPQHHLAQAHQVPLALFLLAKCQTILSIRH